VTEASGMSQRKDMDAVEGSRASLVRECSVSSIVQRTGEKKFTDVATPVDELGP
jgi:hypothetical protein